MTVNFSDIPEEDRAAVKAILEAEIAAGVENPKLPMDVDVDGDGIADAWALDETGELIIIRGVALEETLYEVSGEDDADESDE